MSALWASDSIATTAAAVTPRSVEWKSPSETEHRDAIGAFEGANYEAKGYYRSEQNCIMFTRTEHFCSVCAAAIDDVIDEYTKGPAQP